MKSKLGGVSISVQTFPRHYKRKTRNKRDISRPFHSSAFHTFSSLSPKRTELRENTILYRSRINRDKKKKQLLTLSYKHNSTYRTIIIPQTIVNLLARLFFLQFGMEYPNKLITYLVVSINPQSKVFYYIISLIYSIKV